MLKPLIISAVCLALTTTGIPIIRIGHASSTTVAEIVADTGSFNESYDNAVPVSGSVIVGVQLGESDGNVLVKDTQIVFSNPVDVCVRVVTRDGRFSANNIYRVTTPLADAKSVRLSPITLNYAQVLSNYKKDDTAISAFAARDGSCQPSEAAYLPQLVNPQQPGKNLTILINSANRHCLLLLKNKQTQFRCQPISQGSKIAYDKKCQVAVESLSEGNNHFTLILDDGFDKEEFQFAITP